VEPEFDQFKGLDPDAKDKDIKKLEASDKKKLERLEEAKKKTEENKKKRLEAQAEKEKEKSKKKGSKRKVETPMQGLATSTTNIKEGSSGFSLTQEHLVYGLTPTVQTVDPVSDTDKCIFNLSIGILPGNTKAFNDVQTFLALVNPLPLYLNDCF